MTIRPADGPHQVPGRSSAHVLGVGAAVVAGAGSAVQSRVNGSLADAVGSGFLAAVVSFGSGLVVLAVALFAWPRARAALRRIPAALRPDDGAPRLQWWQCVGGAAGGFFVAAQGLTVGSLGVAVFIVAIVAGQSVTSLVVDRLGLAPGGKRPVTLGRALGPALTVVAVLISVAGSLRTPDAIGLAVLPLLAGAGSAWQQAVNGRVRGVASGVAGDPRGGAAPGVLAATFLNFLVGTVALLLAYGVSVLVAGPPTGSFPTNPWLYTGGVIGIVFIGTAAAVVHRIGVLLLGLGLIAGQIVGALVLDLVTPGAAAPAATTYVGAALTLVAVAVPAVVGAALARRHAGGRVGA